MPDPQCQKYHWSGLWVSTSNPPGKAPFLQLKERCDGQAWFTGQTCRDPTCGLRHKYARPNVGIPMDPFWNIDAVMNPPPAEAGKIARFSPSEKRGRSSQPLWHILDDEGRPLCSGKEQPDGSVKPTPTYEEPRLLKSILKSYMEEPILNGTNAEEKTTGHGTGKEQPITQHACPEKSRTVITRRTTFTCPGSEVCGSRHTWSLGTKSRKISKAETPKKAYATSGPKPTTSKSKKPQKMGKKKAGKPAGGSSVSRTSKGGRPPTREREELRKMKITRN